VVGRRKFSADVGPVAMRLTQHDRPRARLWADRTLTWGFANHDRIVLRRWAD
jgi:hypothetical protein